MTYQKYFSHSRSEILENHKVLICSNLWFMSKCLSLFTPFPHPTRVQVTEIMNFQNKVTLNGKICLNT